MTRAHPLFPRRAARGTVLAGGLLALAAAAPAFAQTKPDAAKTDRSCAAYGAGFQKVPGSDTCVRVGAAVRVDAHTGGAVGSATQGASSGPTSTATDTDPWKTAR